MNADKAYPEIILQLDKPRRAVFNLRAMNRLEEHYEKQTGVKQLWKAIDWKNLSCRDAARILWACLLTDDPTLTFEQVEDIATASSLIENIDALTPAFAQLIDTILERATPVLESKELQVTMADIQKKTGKLKELQQTKALTGSNSSALPS